MSGDQSTTSFGDPTAQPPTPKHTPSSTTSFFPSPIFQTSRIGVDESKSLHTAASTPTPTPKLDWTPRFAEDFSVFNTSPGSVPDSQGPLTDFVLSFSPSVSQPGYQSAPSLTTTPKHHKRPLSAGSLAAEVASHANYVPSNTSLPLPPVEPSRRLPSSPSSLVLAVTSASSASRGNEKKDEEKQRVPPSSNPQSSRSSKKPRRNSAARASKELQPKGQTATPPPSAKKGARMLAPKLHSDAMHNDQGYGHQPQHPHPDFAATPQQQHMSAFVTSPTDLFGYPISAPATASAFADARMFWGNGDASMGSMDMDFSTAGAHVYQSSTAVQQQLGSFDWTQASQENQLYMVTAGGVCAVPEQHQHQHQHQHQLQHQHEHQSRHQLHNPHQHQHQHHQQHHHPHHEHMHQAMGGDPKRLMQPRLDTTAVDQPALYAGAYPTPIDDPFGIVSPSGGVDPGLLFSRPPSSGMDAVASAPMGDTTNLPGTTSYDALPQLPSSSVAPNPMQSSQGSPRRGLTATASVGVRQELRRSASVKELAPRRKASDRTLASSPVKSQSRPGLARSFSENRAPRIRGRASLPTLAPAIKPAPTACVQPAPSMASLGTGLGITRSATVNGGRASGRSSPTRMQYQRQQLDQQQQQQQQRLTNLTSIPEACTPRSRNAVKFTIDANGRARVESSFEADQGLGPPSTLRRNQSARTLHSKSQWDSSSDGDSSSADDEPIIIPSRTSSFALPDPVKPTIGRGPLHSSQRSISSAGSAGSMFVSMRGDDPESEAETVMNDVPKGAGDAASELEKLRQMRQKRPGLASSSSTNNILSSAQRGRRFNSLSGGTGYHGSLAVSPTTLTDVSVPTPSSMSHSNGVRCICGRPDAPVGDDGFVVQCESCEMWLHGRCINITKRTLPSVYICAYCAQTPTARGLRIPPPSVSSSPLAHKSFKKFR